MRNLDFSQIALMTLTREMGKSLSLYVAIFYSCTRAISLCESCPLWATNLSGLS